MEHENCSNAVALSEDDVTRRRSRGENSNSWTKNCWICFATEEDDRLAAWIQPCKCRGTTKWVHQSCLQQWVDEKQKENRERKVACPQCKTEYLIFFPFSNRLVIVLDHIDALVYKICPFIAAGFMVGSLYWTAITYGAVTVMQVVGQNEAMTAMESIEPALLILALPAIPVCLVMFKMFHWEDSLLQFLRKASPNLPLLNYFLPGPVTSDSGSVQESHVSESMSCTRIFTGALLLPTIATVCGNMFFQSVNSPMQRALLGGLSFVAVKGIIKMYHKQQVYKRLSHRRILDYNEENVEMVESSANSVANNSANQNDVRL